MFITLSVFSQNRYYEQPGLRGIHGKEIQSRFSGKELGSLWDDSVEHSVLKKFNSNFRILDSTDYYLGSDGQWFFESRYKTLKYDHYGNVINGETRFFYTETSGWSNKSRAFFTYREPERHIRDYYLNQVWDSEKQVWNDETYAKYFGDNGYTELYVKDWSFKRNKFTGGYRISYTLNDQNLAADRLMQKWDTIRNNWINDMYYTYIYTASKKPQEIVLKIWYKSLDAWVIARRDLYEYDQQGNNIKQIIQYWSASIGWINGYLFDNNFNSYNKTDYAIAFKWNPNKTTWDDIQRNEYRYDTYGNLTELLIYKKNPGDINFSNNQRLTYDYDSKGNQLLYLNQFWSTSLNAWINTEQLINEFNGKGAETSELHQKWDKTQDTWINDYREFNTYSRNGFNVEYYKQVWDLSLGTWINVNKRQNYYSGIKNDNGPVITMLENSGNNSSGSAGKGSELKYSIFPNPASERAIIRFENADKLKIRRMDLLDSSGRILRSENITGNEEITISRRGLMNGKYLLIFTGEKQFRGVMIFE